MSLPKDLPGYEFQRELIPSRDISQYYHLRILKDENGLPALTPDLKPKPQQLNLPFFFGAPAPIEIEVGSGKGTFFLGYCERHPKTPFLALEKEAEFAYLAAGRLAKRSGLPHVRMVLGDAFPFFRDFLPENCAKAIHIYFPDPWPKKRHRKHRIIRSEFLEQVHRVSIQNALLYFGTDHEQYNSEARELFAQTSWLKMVNANAEPTEGIQTNFEIKYRKQGKPIYRCVLEII